MMISRRGLLVGLASLIAAPAIVRAESLMPVKAILVPRQLGTVPIKAEGAIIQPLQWARFRILPDGSIWETSWIGMSKDENGQPKEEELWLPMPKGWHPWDKPGVML